MNTKSLALVAVVAMVAILFAVAPTEDVEAAEGDAFSVNGTTYATLADAVNAAQDGDEIVMLGNASTTSITIDKGITLNLGGNTLAIVADGTNDVAIDITSGETTITNGTITDSRGSGDTGNFRVLNVTGNGTILNTGELTINIVRSTANVFNYGLVFREGATGNILLGTTIEDTEAYSSSKLGHTVGIAVFGPDDGDNPDENSTTTLNYYLGSTTASAYAIAGSGSYDGTQINIFGGTMISTDACAIYHPQRGNLHVTGGYIEGTGGIQYCGSGTLTVEGGIIRATLPETEFPQKPPTQTDGSTDDGAAISIISRGSGYQDAGETITVRITGGTLISDHNSPINSYRLIQDDDDAWVTGDSTNLDSFINSIDVSGGSFEAPEGKSPIAYDAKDESAYAVSGGSFSSPIAQEIMTTDTVLQETADGSMVAVNPDNVDISGSGNYTFLDDDYDSTITLLSDGNYNVRLTLTYDMIELHMNVEVSLGYNTFTIMLGVQEGLGDVVMIFEFENADGTIPVSDFGFSVEFTEEDLPYIGDYIGVYYVDDSYQLQKDGTASLSGTVLTYSGPYHGLMALVFDDEPDMVIPPWGWDDDDEYVPPIVPVQPQQEEDDDTVTIVACAAAAVVAALLAAFLIIDRKH